MRLRSLMLTAFCASIAITAAAPAIADDGWHGRDRREWHEHEWRQHEWRERAWREHEWRERHAWEQRYPPPVVTAPPYGYYPPPPAYYGGPGYYR